MWVVISIAPLGTLHPCLKFWNNVDVGPYILFLGGKTKLIIPVNFWNKYYKLEYLHISLKLIIIVRFGFTAPVNRDHNVHGRGSYV